MALTGDLPRDGKDVSRASECRAIGSNGWRRRNRTYRGKAWDAALKSRERPVKPASKYFWGTRMGRIASERRRGGTSRALLRTVRKRSFGWSSSVCKFRGIPGWAAGPVPSSRRAPTSWARRVTADEGPRARRLRRQPAKGGLKPYPWRWTQLIARSMLMEADFEDGVELPVEFVARDDSQTSPLGRLSLSLKVVVAPAGARAHEVRHSVHLEGIERAIRAGGAQRDRRHWGRGRPCPSRAGHTGGSDGHFGGKR